MSATESGFSESCFSRLPLELVYAVLRHAARDAAVAWRTATSLSLVSRAAHAEVAPIVYHTLVVSQRLDKYRALMRSAAPVLRHVRQLHIYRWLDDHDVRLFAAALGGPGMRLRVVHAPMPLVEMLARGEGFAAREIHVEFAPVGSIAGLRAGVLARVTHLLAFWPDDTGDAAAPCFAAALALPALTHLAIRLAEYDTAPPHRQTFDPAALLSALTAVLAHPCVRHVVVELAGAYLPLLPDVRARLRELADRRVFLCADDRVQPPTWFRHRETFERDALRGDVIWDRGRAVWP